MRKLLFLAFISLSFIACEDITEARPVIQGEVNETIYRSINQAAINSNGDLTIQGSNLDVVTLNINGNTPGIYVITPTSGTTATFESDGISYIANGTDTNESNSSGTIEIEEITNTYVTGNFFFEARRNGTGETLNFSKGVFYQIPFGVVVNP